MLIVVIWDIFGGGNWARGGMDREGGKGEFKEEVEARR